MSSSNRVKAATARAKQSTSTSDFRYTFDESSLKKFRNEQPWKDDPKYFKCTAISPAAIMKMMMHCHSGVERGLKKGSNPIEVMGLLLGRPDPDTPRTLVVTDAFPLPIEGFETRVIAEDEDVLNHMIKLSESMERTRREKFMGWYHSHPFDVGIHSHCYLSQTDISSQLLWQRSEDPHGNPFVAIVIDPLRSLAKNVPELKVFRVYPPEYKSNNECPDGRTIPDELARVEKWGVCWSRYYELDVEYFMSEKARNVMDILTQNYLWMRTLGGTTAEAESRQRFPERLTRVSDKIKDVETNLCSSQGGCFTGPTHARSSAVASLSGNTPITITEKEEGELAKASQGVVELASEKLHSNIVQLAKLDLFGEDTCKLCKS